MIPGQIMINLDDIRGLTEQARTVVRFGEILQAMHADNVSLKAQNDELQAAANTKKVKEEAPAS